MNPLPGWMINLRLKHKLFFVLTIVAVVPLYIAGLNIINRTQAELTQSINENMIGSIANIRSHLEEKFFNQWTHITRTLGSSESLTELSPTMQNVVLTGIVEEYNEFKIVILQTENEILSVGLEADFNNDTAVNELGILYEQEVIASVLDQATYYSPPYFSESFDTFFQVIGIPLRSTMSEHVFLRAIIDLHAIDMEIKQLAFQKNTDVYLVDHTGKLLAASNRKYPTNVSLFDLDQVQTALTSDLTVGIGPFYSNDGQKSICAYTQIMPVNWAIIMEYQESHAYALVNQIRIAFWFWIGGGILFALVAALIFAQLLSKPIEKLKHSAQEISRKNFNHRIEVKRHDEIGELAHTFNQMAVELKKYDEMNVDQMLMEKTRTEAIVRYIVDGVIGLNPEGRILLINNKIEMWFDLRAYAILDKHISDVFEKKIAQRLTKMMSTPEEDEPDHEFEYYINQRRVFFKSAAAKVIDQKGRLLGHVIALRDITKEKEVEELKSQVVSMVAHELRTPLTSIIGFSDLLLQGFDETDSSYEYLKIINEQSHQLNRLITDFLDISRLESGRITPEITRTSLPNICDRVLVVLEPHCFEKSIQIATHYQLPPQTMSYADEGMIERVLTNYVSNAIKYSPEGAAVDIYIEADNDFHVVRVVDTGYGIPEEAIEKLFSRFYRVKTDETRDIQGTGLGLAIVKEIIEKHGGQVFVESEYGKGSMFGFKIPGTNVAPQDH